MLSMMRTCKCIMVKVGRKQKTKRNEIGGNYNFRSNKGGICTMHNWLSGDVRSCCKLSSISRFHAYAWTRQWATGDFLGLLCSVLPANRTNAIVTQFNIMWTRKNGAPRSRHLEEELYKSSINLNSDPLHTVGPHTLFHLITKARLTSYL